MRTIVGLMDFGIGELKSDLDFNYVNPEIRQFEN
jgi:hypothetical protein